MKKEELYKIARDILEMENNLDLKDYEYDFDQRTIDDIIMRINYLRSLYRSIDKDNELNGYITELLITRMARVLPGFLLMEKED